MISGRIVQGRMVQGRGDRVCERRGKRAGGIRSPLLLESEDHPPRHPGVRQRSDNPRTVPQEVLPQLWAQCQSALIAQGAIGRPTAGARHRSKHCQGIEHGIAD